MTSAYEYEVTVSDVTTSASDQDPESDSDQDTQPENDNANAKAKLEEIRRLRMASEHRAAVLEQKLDRVSNTNTKTNCSTSSIPAQRKSSSFSNAESSVKAASERFTAAAAEAKERKVLIQKRYAWKKEFLVLSRNVRALDRECSSFVTSNKGELAKVLREAEMELAAQDQERKKECGRIMSRVDKAKWAMRQFMNAVEEVGTGDAYLARLKSLMEGAEKRVLQAKGSIAEALEDGIQEETILQRQLDHFNTRLLQLQETKALKAKEPNAPTLRENTGLRRQRKPSGGHRNELSAKVTRIDAEIGALGGSTGGWDSIDHQNFLQALSRLKITSRRMQLFDISQEDMDKLVAKVLTQAPTQTETAVRKHAQWYCKYTQLLQQKKELVQSWKATTKQSTIEPQQRAETLEDTPVKQKPMDRTAQALKKKKIAEWRRSKALKAQQLQKEEEERRKLEIRRQQLLLHKRQREKEQLALQKLEREAELAHSRELEEAPRNKEDQSRQANCKSKKAFKERQDRNMQLALERRKANEMAKQKKISRMERIEQLHVKPIASATRDSSRLLKVTKAREAKRITPNDLDDYVNLRHARNAHDGVVPSAAGAERRAKGYGIALGPVSGRMVPSWKR